MAVEIDFLLNSNFIGLPYLLPLISFNIFVVFYVFRKREEGYILSTLDWGHFIIGWSDFDHIGEFIKY